MMSVGISILIIFKLLWNFRNLGERNELLFIENILETFLNKIYQL